VKRFLGKLIMGRWRAPIIPQLPWPDPCTVLPGHHLPAWMIGLAYFTHHPATQCEAYAVTLKRLGFTMVRGFPATTYVRYGRMQHGGASALELDDENAVEIDMRGTRHVVFPVRGGRQDYRGCRYSRRPSMRSQTAFEKMTDKPGDRA